MALVGCRAECRSDTGKESDKMMKVSANSVPAILEAYTANQKTTRRIGEEFGVSPATITVLAKKNGLILRSRGRRPASAPTRQQSEILSQARSESYAKVGERLGVSRQRIHQLMRRFIGPKPKRGSRSMNKSPALGELKDSAV
jgi:predicted XRE-type DNA-binding protein